MEKKCKWCGSSTGRLCIDECDYCWEMRYRIDENIVIAERMIAEAKRKREVKT